MLMPIVCLLSEGFDANGEYDLYNTSSIGTLSQHPAITQDVLLYIRLSSCLLLSPFSSLFKSSITFSTDISLSALQN